MTEDISTLDIEVKDKTAGQQEVSSSEEPVLSEKTIEPAEDEKPIMDMAEIDKKMADLSKKLTGPDEGIVQQLTKKAKENLEKRKSQLKIICMKDIERIRGLQDEKYKLNRHILTADDIRQLAKRKLRELKDKIIVEDILIPHFEKVQKRKQAQLFSPLTLEQEVFRDTGYWKFLFNIITEEHIDQAVDALPQDIGIPIADIEKQLDEIENEFDQVKAKIESDLQQE